MALPFTGSSRSSSAGISVLVPVASDEPMRKHDMMSAATSSMCFVLRMRACSSEGSASVPFTRWMWSTPVSKPESPSASFGNTRSEMPAATHGPVPDSGAWSR
jgi:hypothetical protein